MSNKSSDKAEARRKAEQKRELEDKLFTDDGSYLLDREERLVADWMKSMLDTELKRIKAAGSNAIPIPVKNTGIMIDGTKTVNRIEANTGFNFDKIQQLMVSDPTPCPHKDGYNYVNVLLFTTQPVPIIMPYLYDTATPNKLKSWLFVNNCLEESRQKVKKFRGV